MDVVVFAAAMLFWIALVAIPGAFLFKKMKGSSSTATEMTQNAEATLTAFAGRVGGSLYPPRQDAWGTRYLPGVRYRRHAVDADLTYAFIQGSSKNERVSLPYLVVAPPPGSTWRQSPVPAIREALQANLGMLLVESTARMTDTGCISSRRRHACRATSWPRWSKASSTSTRSFG